MSSRREDKLNQVAVHCRDRASPDRTSETKISIVSFDAAAPDIDSIVQNALALTGGIDVLILNAGIYQLKPALETGEWNWKDFFNTGFGPNNFDTIISVRSYYSTLCTTSHIVSLLFILLSITILLPTY